jgi:hypothetical protein
MFDYKNCQWENAMINKQLKLALILVCSILTGCATIMGSENHVMPISSSPNDALIVITDEKGVEVFKGTTPTSVTLKKSDGTYFGKKSYIVKITKSGYESQSIPVKASPSGWYIAGNFIFGGLIGWLIIDPLNGKMYNLSPENINSNLLVSSKSSRNSSSTNGIYVMLLNDVPIQLRDKLALIE